MALSGRTIKKIAVYVVLGVFLLGTALSAAMYFINPIANQPEEAIIAEQGMTGQKSSSDITPVVETGVVDATR